MRAISMTPWLLLLASTLLYSPAAAGNDQYAPRGDREVDLQLLGDKEAEVVLEDAASDPQAGLTFAASNGSIESSSNNLVTYDIIESPQKRSSTPKNPGKEVEESKSHQEAQSLKELLKQWGIDTSIRAQRGDIEVTEPPRDYRGRGDVPVVAFSHERSKRQARRLAWPKADWGYGEDEGYQADRPREEDYYAEEDDEEEQQQQQRRMQEEVKGGHHRKHHQHGRNHQDNEVRRQEEEEEERRRQWEEEQQQQQRRMQEEVKGGHHRKHHQHGRNHQDNEVRRQEEEEERRRQWEEEQQQQQQQRRRRPEQPRRNEPAVENERKTAQPAAQDRPEEHMSYEERMRQWQRMKEAYDKLALERQRGGNRNRTKTPEELENERKLQDYIRRNTPIDVTGRRPGQNRTQVAPANQRRPEDHRPEDRRRPEERPEDRRRPEERPEDRRQPKPPRRNDYEEQIRRQQQEQLRRQQQEDEERRRHHHREEEERRRHQEAEHLRRERPPRPNNEEEEHLRRERPPRPNEEEHSRRQRPPRPHEEEEHLRRERPPRPSEEEEQRLRENEAVRQAEHQRRWEQEQRRRLVEEQSRRFEEEQRKLYEAARTRTPPQAEQEGIQRVERPYQPAKTESRNDRYDESQRTETPEPDNRRKRPQAESTRKWWTERPTTMTTGMMEEAGNTGYPERRRPEQKGWMEEDNRKRYQELKKHSETVFRHRPTTPVTPSRRNELRPEDADEEERLRRLESVPVASRLTTPRSPVNDTQPPQLAPRFGAPDGIDFPGFSPNKRGPEANKFPAPATIRPPAKSPKACVWAIVVCCRDSLREDVERQSRCFEATECLSWDQDRCREENVKAANREIMNFYIKSRASFL